MFLYPESFSSVSSSIPIAFSSISSTVIFPSLFVTYPTAIPASITIMINSTNNTLKNIFNPLFYNERY